MLETFGDMMPRQLPIRIDRDTEAVREIKALGIKRLRENKLSEAAEVWMTRPSLATLKVYEQAYLNVQEFDPSQVRRTSRLVVFGYVIPLAA